jgi:RNA polymerase sigma factor (sigma-70 family)
MNDTPDTRHELLVRLRDAADADAWQEFMAIYEPVIRRLIEFRGFQDADAQELTQEALLAVLKAMEHWDGDPSRGSFRGWLFRTTRNLMVNFLTRARPGTRGTGDTIFLDLLHQHPARSPAAESQFGLEYKREVFQWAEKRVRDEFEETTWQAFHMTHLRGASISDTAQTLGITTGAVYAARSRVMAALKREVKRWEDPEEDQS